MSEQPTPEQRRQAAIDRAEAAKAARDAEIAAEAVAFRAQVERFKAAVSRLQARHQAAIELWTPQIEAAPLSRCAKHPIDLATDVEPSAVQSQKLGRLVIVPETCPLCREEADIRRAESKLLRAGIPPRQLPVRLSTWDASWEPTFAFQRADALSKVAGWVKDRPSPFMVILGARGGTGKTALGVAALRALSTDIRFVEYRDLIEGAMAMEFDERNAEISALRQMGALLIDDVGNRQIGAKDTAGGNAFERDIMAQILNARFERRLPTIITTNLDGRAFAGRLDDRTVDRIRAGRLVIDASKWPSKRAAEAGI